MILQKANEELLISIFLQYPQFLGKHIHAITADMFSPMIRPIFTELVNTIGRDETPDLVTMTARLRYQGKLDEVGGAATLTEYWTTPVTGQNLNMPINEIPAALNEAEKMIETASKIQGKPLASKGIGELTITLIEDIEKRMLAGGALVGISTGFPFIDSKTGGMQGGRVWVIAGKPGDGKSVLMQNFLESAVALGKKVRIYPLEMTQQEQAYRLLCSQGNLDNQSVWKGMMTRAEQAALMEAVEEIIASISRRLKRTAVKCGKVILTASQLNDFGQLRESRAIGQDADHIIYIEKVDDDDSKRLIKCIKNRTGERFWEKQLDFLGQFYKFREQAE